MTEVTCPSLGSHILTAVAINTMGIVGYCGIEKSFVPSLNQTIILRINTILNLRHVSKHRLSIGCPIIKRAATQPSPYWSSTSRRHAWRKCPKVTSAWWCLLTSPKPWKPYLEVSLGRQFGITGCWTNFAAVGAYLTGRCELEKDGVDKKCRAVFRRAWC